MDAEQVEVKKLYERSRTHSLSSAPRRRLMGFRCPECNGKLKKQILKHPLFCDQDSSDEFVEMVLNENGVPPGLYRLTITHFICDCGYTFIKSTLDKVDLD